MIPLMPSLAKGTHAFRPSQQTVGVNEPTASGVMDSPELQIHDSDEDLPPQSTPPQPSSVALSSVALSSTAPSATSSQKRKHAALTSVTDSFRSSSLGLGLGPSEKKQRGSGIAVLGGIKDSIDEFKTIMRTGMPLGQVRAADQAAAYRVQAMDKVQMEEPDLDDNQVVALVDLFRTDSSAAEAYMAIVRPTICKAWLNKQLRLLGFLDQAADRGSVNS
jgi:hypothetical protein